MLSKPRIYEFSRGKPKTIVLSVHLSNNFFVSCHHIKFFSHTHGRGYRCEFESHLVANASSSAMGIDRSLPARCLTMSAVVKQPLTKYN